MPIIAFGQKNNIEQNKFDSVGRTGYWKLPTTLNYINDEKRYNGVSGYEYGFYNKDKKIGVWDVKDKNNVLIGRRVYVNDTTIIEMQYKEGKIFSIVTLILSEPMNLGNVECQVTLKEEVVSFNENGEIRSSQFGFKQ